MEPVPNEGHSRRAETREDAEFKNAGREGPRFQKANPILYHLRTEATGKMASERRGTR